MSFMSDRQLARIRQTISSQMLPDTCVIRTASNSSDGAGGWEQSWSPVASGTVACRVDPLNRLSGQLNVEIGAEKLTKVYRLTVPYGAPIAAHSQIVFAGEEYEIMQLDDEHSWNASRRAVIARVE